MIAQDTIERLVAVGRSKGFLDTQDLLEALPVQTMSPEDIALVVVRLEDAGVPVELDESLLAGRATSLRPVKVPDHFSADRSDRPPPIEPRASRTTLGGNGKSEAAASPATRGGAHAAVIIGGVVAAAVILALLAILIR